MSEELKPCPFCGGEAYVVPGVYRDGGYIEHAAYAQCTKCGARTDEASECMPEMQVHDMAVSLWNRRAERMCRVVRSGEPTPTGVPRERRCSECGGRLTRFGAYCHNCGARVVEE